MNGVIVGEDMEEGLPDAIPTIVSDEKRTALQHRLQPFVDMITDIQANANSKINPTERNFENAPLSEVEQFVTDALKRRVKEIQDEVFPKQTVNGVVKYRKKPVVIEAIQFTGNNTGHIVDWANSDTVVGDSSAKTISIKTLEGTMVANICDWIIKGVSGEFYPCKSDIFEKTYELFGATPNANPPLKAE